jgi:RHS repeat-associated protein
LASDLARVPSRARTRFTGTPATMWLLYRRASTRGLLLARGATECSSTVALSDTTGALVREALARSSPRRARRATSAAYGSHHRDDESHLLYMGARYYDPALSRFTQPDSVVPERDDPQSWNRYSYTRNNPVNRVDPTGHFDLGATLAGELAARTGGHRGGAEFFGSVLTGTIPVAESGQDVTSGLVKHGDEAADALSVAKATGGLRVRGLRRGRVPSPERGLEVSSLPRSTSRSMRSSRRFTNPGQSPSRARVRRRPHRPARDPSRGRRAG